MNCGYARTAIYQLYARSITPKDPKEHVDQSSDLGKDQGGSSQLTCENNHVDMQSGECNDNNDKSKEMETDVPQIQVSTHSGEKRSGDTECSEEEANCMPSCVNSDPVNQTSVYQRDPLKEF